VFLLWGRAYAALGARNGWGVPTLRWARGMVGGCLRCAGHAEWLGRAYAALGTRNGWGAPTLRWARLNGARTSAALSALGSGEG